MFVTNFARYLLCGGLQHLILHVTNRCNYRCRHCFIDSTTNHDLSLELVRAHAMDIGSLFWLDIGGGEPFLRADLPELIAAFDARVIMIPSNGLMTDDIYGGLKEITEQSDSEVGISLSLDGLQETNDQIRHKGSWEAVWATFERVRSLDTVSVKINTVLCKENHAEILELMEEVRKHRPDFHSVILLRDTPNAPPTKLPDLRDLRKLSQDILRIQERYSYGRNRIAYFPHILNALIQDMS